MTEHVDQVAREMAERAYESIRKHRRQCALMWAAYFFLIVAAITAQTLIFHL